MAVGRRDSNTSAVEETTPLLPHDVSREAEKHGNKKALIRALVCAFLVSLSFGVTQVP
jgi:hypothetical protein